MCIIVYKLYWYKFANSGHLFSKKKKKVQEIISVSVLLLFSVVHLTGNGVAQLVERRTQDSMTQGSNRGRQEHNKT